MNWDQTCNNLNLLEGRNLSSISGRSDIKLLEVSQQTVILESSNGQKTRPISELTAIVRRMELLYPVHVDTVLMGSGSSRNQPETILANMPDVEWMTLNNRKHIVWVGRQTHPVGTLKELDSVLSNQVRERFRGKGPVIGAHDTASLLVLAPDPREASILIKALFQVPKLEPLIEGDGYHVSAEFGEVYLVPVIEAEKGLEIIPIATVFDREETILRVRTACADVVIREYDVGMIITLLRFSDGGVIAII